MAAFQLLPYYFDDRRLEPQWIDFGFEILRGAGPRTPSSKRCQFENRLVGQTALADFGRAISYIDAAPEPLARLQLLVAVIDALESESMRRQK